jgi:hypothetical protein
MRKAVFAITNELHADEILNQLKLAGFSSDDISVLVPSGARPLTPEGHTKAPEGTTTGGVTGGVIGGALGWLAGVGALAIGSRPASPSDQRRSAERPPRPSAASPAHSSEWASLSTKRNCMRTRSRTGAS